MVAFHSSSFCYSLMIVRYFDVIGPSSFQVKQIRHWSLIRIMYCPALCPGSNLFPGLAARSPSFTVQP
jgi:hypothetical protein